MAEGLKVARWNELTAGDLFLFQSSELKAVGMICELGVSRRWLCLGPQFPKQANGPVLREHGLDAPVVSFGKNYNIKLPVKSEDWYEAKAVAEFPENFHWLLVVGCKTYLRARLRLPQTHHPAAFTAWFVDVKTGGVEINDQEQPSMPSGPAAWAANWEIVTTEPAPRTILKYPPPAEELTS